MSHNLTHTIDSPMIEEMSEDEFKNSIIRSGKSAVVMFYMAGCPHCRGFLPEFEKLSEKIETTTLRVEISNYHDNDLWDQFHIEAVPTVIAFKNGQICTRLDSSHGTCISRQGVESEIRTRPECFTK